MSNEIDLTLLDSLSPEEKAAALEILRQYAIDGKSELLDDFMYNDFDEVPVDIDTFLDDQRYLGNDI